VLYAAWRHLGHLLAADPQLTTGIRARTLLDAAILDQIFVELDKLTGR
jgi:hypothetical protein